MTAEPLTGWRVLVSRPVEHAAGYVDALRLVGADTVAVQLISIEPPVDPGPLAGAVQRWARGEFSWVGFTSAQAVMAFAAQAAGLGAALDAAGPARVAAVGPATAAAARTVGLAVDLIPVDGGSGAALADCWPRAEADADARILLPRSDLASQELPDALRAKGYQVQDVTAYRTVPKPPPPDIAADLAAGGFAAVLFTSPSTVAAVSGGSIAASTLIGAIGEPTAKACRAAGLRVDVIAARPTPDCFVGALAAMAQQQPQSIRRSGHASTPGGVSTR